MKKIYICPVAPIVCRKLQAQDVVLLILRIFYTYVEALTAFSPGGRPVSLRLSSLALNFCNRKKKFFCWLPRASPPLAISVGAISTWLWCLTTIQRHVQHNNYYIYVHTLTARRPGRNSEYIEYIEVAVKLKQAWDHSKGAVTCAANRLRHFGVIAY